MQHIDDPQLQQDLKEIEDDRARSEAEITDEDLVKMERQNNIHLKARELEAAGFKRDRAVELATQAVDGRSGFVEGLAEVERFFGSKRSA